MTDRGGLTLNPTSVRFATVGACGIGVVDRERIAAEDGHRIDYQPFGQLDPICRGIIDDRVGDRRGRRTEDQGFRRSGTESDRLPRAQGTIDLQRRGRRDGHRPGAADRALDFQVTAGGGTRNAVVRRLDRAVVDKVGRDQAVAHQGSVVDRGIAGLGNARGISRAGGQHPVARAVYIDRTANPRPG